MVRERGGGVQGGTIELMYHPLVILTPADITTPKVQSLYLEHGINQIKYCRKDSIYDTYHAIHTSGVIHCLNVLR